MAREKYNPHQNLENLKDPAMWIHWTDSNGEIHHTPRSLAAIIPDEANIVR